MDTAAHDRLAFTPPPQPGMLRAMVLAVLAHVMLVAALTWGLRWQTEAQNVVAEAELWSAVPREAAPPVVVAPPQPPIVAPPPAPPPPPPLPEPARVVRAPPLPDPQVQRNADIAVERDRQQREDQKRELAEKRELQRREAQKREVAERREADKRELAQRRKEELENERDRKRKLDAAAERKLEAAERKRDQEQALKQEQAKLVADAKRRDDDKKRKQQEQDERDSKRVAQQRDENMKRMQGLAGSGGSGSSGSAAQSSGPSASWGSKVQARVRPHIVFSDDVAGNPRAEVEVRMAPDGTIIGKRLVKSSGVKAWDDAVLRALDKAESLPRDTDGRVHSPVTIEFRPRG